MLAILFQEKTKKMLVFPKNAEKNASTIEKGLPANLLLEDNRHLARLHRRRRCRRRRRAYAPTSNTASHDNHEKINSWASFSFLYGYGVRLSAILIRNASRGFSLKRSLRYSICKACEYN